jgi:hypothetical protein
VTPGLSVDAYVLLQWETAKVSGTTLLLAKNVDQETCRWEGDEVVLRASTLFFPSGTDFEKVAEAVEHHMAESICATCGGDGEVLCGDQFWRDCESCRARSAQ